MSESSVEFDGVYGVVDFHTKGVDTKVNLVYKTRQFGYYQVSVEQNGYPDEPLHNLELKVPSAEPPIHMLPRDDRRYIRQTAAICMKMVLRAPSDERFHTDP